MDEQRDQAPETMQAPVIPDVPTIGPVEATDVAAAPAPMADAAPPAPAPTTAPTPTTTAAPGGAPTGSPERREGGFRREGGGPPRREGGFRRPGQGGPGGPRGRGRRAAFPKDMSLVNYRNVDLLQRFLNEAGQIKPRRKTGATAKQQRILTRAVKRARHLALLPYSAAQSRG